MAVSQVKFADPLEFGSKHLRKLWAILSVCHGAVSIFWKLYLFLIVCLADGPHDLTYI